MSASWRVSATSASPVTYWASTTSGASAIVAAKRSMVAAVSSASSASSRMRNGAQVEPGATFASAPRITPSAIRRSTRRCTALAERWTRPASAA